MFVNRKGVEICDNLFDIESNNLEPRSIKTTVCIFSNTKGYKWRLATLC